MLVLYETPAGYALFRASGGDGLLSDAEKTQAAFASAAGARAALSLASFARFGDTSRALRAAEALGEGRMDKALRRFLREAVPAGEALAVADARLGAHISRKMPEVSIAAVPSDAAVAELFRGIRTQLDALLADADAAPAPSDLQAMALGLSHSLGRFRLRFSPDRVDTMVVQAVGLLDELDKELNGYAMRLKEWYGWHFPELARVVVDATAYARVVLALGVRTAAASTDLSAVLPAELEAAVRAAAEVSTGTEIAEDDLAHMSALAAQVVAVSEYRAELASYLRARMAALAPNLTALLGELVGARLLARAGSLLSLAKLPASTLQILGAEKALFRALKTKHDTPKYGLIYHASLVGQAAPRLKGKVSRMLAAKTSLAVRVDALSERAAPQPPAAAEDGDDAAAAPEALPDLDDALGQAAREHVEKRLRELEAAGSKAPSRSGTPSRGGFSRGGFSRGGSARGGARPFSSAGDFPSSKRARPA